MLPVLTGVNPRTLRRVGVLQPTANRGCLHTPAAWRFLLRCNICYVATGLAADCSALWTHCLVGRL